MLHTGRGGQFLSSCGSTGAHSKSLRFSLAGRLDHHRRMVSFRLNDEIVDVPNDDLHTSAASFIRQHTQCKSVKVSCNEGGCGACAVELLSPAGDGSILAVNSCLLPVAALDGCHVLTSEGLGNSRTGYHEVQARLAAFHGTQCGFCSPGITVSTHAALMAAAAQKAQTTTTTNTTSSSSSSHSKECNGVITSSNGTGAPPGEHQQCNDAADAAANGTACQHKHAHGSCKGSGSCKAKQATPAAAAEGVTRVTAAQLLGALDGNLCRCTGWRPIADCAKSFACDVDIEDLGLNSLAPDRLAPISLNDLTPAALKHPVPQQQQQQQQQSVTYAKALQQLQPGSVLAPDNMEQLLQALSAAAAVGLPVHLLGGNTGAGLYKDQWEKLSSSVCVLVRGVRELQEISVSVSVQEKIAMGAAAAKCALAGAGENGLDSSFDGYIGVNGIRSSSISKGSNGHLTGSRSWDDSRGSISGPAVVAGAGVTITRLLQTLQDTVDTLQAQHTNAGSAKVINTNTTTQSAAATVAGKSSQEQQQQQQQQDVANLQYMICHIRRIAGTLVRNAATLGGHLALARSSQLESDLATLFVAAGADVCIASADGSCTWVDVEDLCRPQKKCREAPQAALDLLHKQQAVITAVCLPLPLSSSSKRVAFWSHKLTAHRQFNEHAVVNAAMWMEWPISITSSSSSSQSNAAVGDDADGYNIRIAIGTYQQLISSVMNTHDDNSHNPVTGHEQQQQQQASKRYSDGAWLCTRAYGLEKSLLEVLEGPKGRPEVKRSLLACLPDMLGMELLWPYEPAGRLGAYVERVLPGLILKGISAVWPEHLLLQEQQEEQQQQSRPSSPRNIINTSGDVVGTYSDSSANGDHNQEYDVCQDIDAALVFELRQAAANDLAAAVAGPVFQSGHQDLPVNLTSAPPLYWPTERDGGQLQASGEAVYADDVPIVAGALHAAYVTSTVPYAQLVEVDWSSAMTVPGVVGWVGPQDIPAGPDALIQSHWAGPQQPLFAHTHVTHVGQSLGLILAKTPAAAQAGASKVSVTYAPVTSSSSSSSSTSPIEDATSSGGGSSGSSSAEDTQAGLANGTVGRTAEAAATAGGDVRGALTTLSAAVAADSWFSLDKFPGTDKASAGDASAAMSSAARVLSGQVKAGSQRHFYMEPQVAIVTPDEGGRLHVVSSCQGCDVVLFGICRALKLRHNEVHVTSRRVGGGFGGKAAASVFHAAAAAVAAHKFRRQVRLVVPQSVDVSMNAGRCPMVMNWRAGLEEQGRIQALQLDLTLKDGAYGGGTVEAISMKSVADSVYDLPHMDFNLKLARTNMPPRSTVRGPGKVSMIILLELMMQQLAAATGHTADQYRQMHMLKLPQDALEAAAAAAAEADTSAPAGLVGLEGQQQQQQQGKGSLVDKQQVIPHPKYLPNPLTTSSRGEDTDSSKSDTTSSSSSSSLKTALGQPIEVHHYTLPYMLQQVQASSDYAARRIAVDAFNSSHSTKKRGLALVPVRYPLYRSFYIGRVTIYCDGSILLSHAGVEIGQGISSKVKQTAAATLGQLLPPEARGDLLPYIRVAGGSTELMAHAGIAAGSTTSEGATAAIAAACDELVGRLRESAEKLQEEGQEVTWEAVVKGVCGWEVMTTKVLLTASARGGLHDESAAPAAMYQSFGVGAAEVEVDCLTGERRLLRADLMFDAGKSVSPAIDMGQIEGAFMNGVGYVMTEEVVEDESSGVNLTDTTWTYKPPGIAELPQVFNVSMLRDSPCHVPQRQQLSAKATGEPPLMMAAAVACALQDAAHAAWRQYEQQRKQRGQAVQGPDSWPVLELPATTASILQALPPQLI